MKKSIRKYLISIRDSLPIQNQIEYSRTIHEKLLSTPEWKRSNIVMFYISINSEVMTLNLLSKAFDEKKVILLPKVTNEGMISVKVPHNFKLITGYKGILEPYEGETFNNYIDLILVPLVGFDKEGYRIGYGGGFYDTFLSKNSKRIGLKIGLAYECQKIKYIPKEKHDQKLDIIITEKNIYLFNT
ncbi:MAG: 5-formyltetrahydrofolate cyclo-ligase [Brevinematia bacterium]